MVTSPTTLRPRIIAAAERSVDAASLAVFRIGLGLIMLWEVGRYFHYGWIRDFYVETKFNFTYPGLDWLKPLPGAGMYLLFLVLGAAAICVCLGRFYKSAMSVLAIGLSYVLLLEQTAFLNHLYLVSLICWLMIGVPADCEWSWRRSGNTHYQSATLPSWCLWMIRTQIAIAYVYGGIVKFNPDWLAGQPLQLWMLQMTELRAWVPIYGERWLAIGMSWAGLVIDLLIVPALLWQPTRKAALVIAVIFHLWNFTMFHIGIFPWFMIVATTLFLPPEWPRRLMRKGVTSAINETIQTTRFVAVRQTKMTCTLALLAVWFTIQLLVPWRHLLYEGNVDWTEEGTRFAWRMMLHDKWSALQITLVDPRTKQTRPFDPRAFLSQRQIDKMSYEPELLRQFAQHVASLAAESELGRQEVHAFVLTSLNGREPQLLVDPTVDLGAEPFRWRRQPWIMPLTKPLPPQPWMPPVDKLGLPLPGKMTKSP